MERYLELYEKVYDKVSGKEVVLVYISDTLTNDCYLVEPIDGSFEPDWRYENDLEILTEKQRRHLHKRKYSRK